MMTESEWLKKRRISCWRCRSDDGVKCAAGSMRKQCQQWGFPYLPERYELTPTYADAAHFYAAVVDRTAARWPDETKAIMLEGGNDARRKS